MTVKRNSEEHFLSLSVLMYIYFLSICNYWCNIIPCYTALLLLISLCLGRSQLIFVGHCTLKESKKCYFTACFLSIDPQNLTWIYIGHDSRQIEYENTTSIATRHSNSIISNTIAIVDSMSVTMLQYCHCDSNA